MTGAKKSAPAFNVKAIVSDFDGTLVDSSFAVSTELKEAIRNWQKAGNHFSISTGRGYPGIIEEICHSLEIVDPVATNGGAEIFDPLTNQLLDHQAIDQADLDRLLSILNDANVQYVVQTPELLFSNYEPDTPFNHSAYQGLLPTNFSRKDVSKVRLITELAESRSLIDLVANTIKPQFPMLSVMESNTVRYQGVDITSEKATKHLATLRLSELLQVPPTQMAGIGDGMNDYPLLTACGYKVAISTAPPEIKEIADQIIAPQSESGVTSFINSLVAG